MARRGGEVEQKAMLQRLTPHKGASKGPIKRLSRAKMRGKRGIRK
jgi:hypothetical protein